MKRLLTLVGVLVALLFLAGCVSATDQNGALPWSAPASWENQTIGVPL